MKKGLLGALPILAASLVTGTATADDWSWGWGWGWSWFNREFKRVSTFPVYLNEDVDTESVAEIVAAANNGYTLVYTDSENGTIGFVDITDPHNPLPDGTVDVGGEPTSVAVRGDYALVGVNTSPDFVSPSGVLQIIDVNSRNIVRTIDLGGQPDSVAVSPNGKYAAIVIENERDEDLGDGAPPQAPGGFLVTMKMVGNVNSWNTTVVDLSGIADKFPNDPEPEYVDINSANVAVVTLQENNHIILVRLSNNQIIGDFSAGSVDLTKIDTNENDLIEFDSSLNDVVREPDGVTWTSNLTFFTADEGDLDGGSRGFTSFSRFGHTLYTAGNSVEHIVGRAGHYPEGRSENKGNEPENVEYGRYPGGKQFLFVGSERSNLLLVYRLYGGFFGAVFPEFVQSLPSGGVAPEGLLAIPNRNLLVVANEKDDRGDKFRSALTIFELTHAGNYPTIQSANRDNGAPIPWAALSGLAVGSDGARGGDASTIYTIHDSFYQKSRVYEMDVSGFPATITNETMLVDSGDVLLGSLSALKGLLPGTDDFDPASLINDDHSVNLDPEGIATRTGGGWWVASEGAGNLDAGVSDPGNRPFESPSMIIGVQPDGTIDTAIQLPLDVVSNQLRFGFEGVAEVGNVLYVCFQRAWQNSGDPADRARIGCYDLNTGEWTFAHYPLDAPTSPNGGWVGLSEITYLGNNEFAVIERDNQGNTDATIKRIYTFSIDGVTFKSNADVATFDVIGKSLAHDLMTDPEFAATNALMLEKWEGLAVMPNGDVLIVNDNDGIDDSTGETQLLNLGDVIND